jgi:hypothetical protein
VRLRRLFGTPKVLVTSIVFMASLGAVEREPETSASTDDLSHLNTLANDKSWLKLIHSPRAYGNAGGKSDILTAEFFLSPKGSIDPAAELAATIEAMRAPAGSDPDSHAQCRFPARYIWLKRQGLPEEAAPPVKCNAFEEWLGPSPPTGASLIFGSGYFGHPSTFYGHMLFRFNSDETSSPDRDQLLSTTLNHGALYPANENGLLYVHRGLTGGYRSTFSELEFFNHLEPANERQLRDVWEYLCLA